MPKISVDEDGNLLARKSNIGASGYSLIMLLKINPVASEIAKYDPLSLGVLGTDLRHDLAPLFLGEYVHLLRA
jgi:hypothetical protein